MIQSFVDRFMKNQDTLSAAFAEKHPDDYTEIVKRVVEVIRNENVYDEDIDPDRIHTIDDGDYQGTLVYVIAESG